MKSYALSALVLAIAMSGCSLISPKSAPTVSATQTVNTLVSESDSVATQQHPERKVRHRSIYYGSLTGEWTIVKVDGKEIPFEDEMPYIGFDEKQWTFYAYNGCNVLNGQFLLPGERIISFDNVISTFRYCPDSKFEYEINGVLRDGSKHEIKIENEGRETFLYFYNDGKEVMKMRRHNLNFLNGQWNVHEINGNNVDEMGLNIFFDIPEMKVHGNTGCNFFNGVIEIDPSVDSSLAFRNMAVTMRACPGLETERDFLVALEQAAVVSNSGYDTITLLDEQGRKLITLYRDNTVKVD